jgi:hypothetical protein
MMRLAPKALYVARICQEDRRERFDGDLSPMKRVVRLIHIRHSTYAKQPLNDIDLEPLANEYVRE